MDAADLTALLRPEVQAWFAAHVEADPTEIAMGRGIGGDLPRRALAEQLRCRGKARHKLPAWVDAGCLFAPRALEQCSSQATAVAKAGALGGQRVLDLGAGLGVDAWAAAAAGARVIACERDPALAALLRHNAACLGVEFELREADGIAVAAELPPGAVDLVFADPDRRPGSERVLDLAASSPALPSHIGELCRLTPRMLVKLAPGADAVQAAEQLPHVQRFEWVSWRGECRELLAHCDAAAAAGPAARVARGVDDAGAIRWEVHGPAPTAPVVAAPGAWWVEPDPAVIRAGLVGSVAVAHGLAQLHPRVAYLTGDAEPSAALPGRRYRVLDHGPYRAKELRRALRDRGCQRLAIARRHFPREPAAIARELRITDGGRQRLACYRDAGGGLCYVLAEPA